MSNVKAFWALIVTVLIWASSFAVIKLGLQEINPYFLAFIRAFIAAAFLVAIIAVKDELGGFLRYLTRNWKATSATWRGCCAPCPVCMTRRRGQRPRCSHRLQRGAERETAGCEPVFFVSGS